LIRGTTVCGNRKNLIFGGTPHWKGRIDTNRYNVMGISNSLDCELLRRKRW